MRGWSTLASRSSRARSGLRVVDSTVAPRSVASVAALSPTVEVPPRISSVCPARSSRPVVREPYAVWNISGSAPTTSHGRPVSNGMTCAAGTLTYWAYEPWYERPMPPIMVATC